MNTAFKQFSAFDNTIIEEDEFKNAYDLIEYVHSSTCNKQPSGAFIIGESGTGKTAVLEAYLSDNPSRQTQERDHIPVVYINAATTPSIHGFATILIDALDCTGVIPKSIQGKKKRIQVLKEELGLELVIIDEFHDMLTEGANATNTGVVNFVKYLLSQLKVSVIAAGLPHSKDVLRQDAQLATRCCSTAHMNVFSAANAAEAERYQMYMNGLLESYPYELEEISTDEFLLRILLATGGNKRCLKKLFQRAASLSEYGKKTSLAIIEESWTKEINDAIRVCPNTNPFTAKITKVEKALRNGGLL